MLENLDRIDWGMLSHASGGASDVPDLLRGLASTDAEIRDPAMYELHGALWHQGTIYEAAPYAVPFLLELLQEPAVLKKEQIVAFLRTLATGTAVVEDDQNVPDYASKIRAAVLVGLPLYLDLLSNEAADMRVMAAYLLAVCDPRRDEIWPALVEGLAPEPSPAARAARVIALLELAQTAEWSSVPDEASRTLAELMRSELEPPLVRAASAFFLVSLRDDEALEEARFVLQESFDAAKEPLESLPWDFDTDLVGEVNEALWETPDARLQRIQEMLSGRDQEVRCNSIQELADSVEREPSLAPKVIPHLLELVTDDDVVVRTYIEVALSEIGATSDLVTRVQPFLNHPHKGVRLTARMIVQKIETARSGAR